MKKIILLIAIINCLFINTNAQNNCLDFDGGDDYVQANSTYSFEANESFTIEAWVKINAQEEVNFATLHNRQLAIGMNSSGQFIGISYTDAVQTHNSGYELEPGIWYHLAAVFSGGSSTLYVNGVSQGNAANANSEKTGQMIYVGRGYVTGLIGSFTYLNGQMDEVRFWEEARTQSEIRNNMYDELSDPTSETNLLLYYKFNETSGTTADNAEGTAGYDGTLNGSMTTGDWVTSPAFFGPKYCLDFDGTNDYVDCGDVDHATDVITLEAWVYLNASVSDYGRIISKSETGSLTVSACCFTLNFNNSTQPEFSIDGTRITSPTAVSTTQWHHIAGTYDKNAGSDQMKLYVDGELVGTNTKSTDIPNSAHELTLGAGYAGIVGNYYLNGRIDEARLWDRALPIEEIRENMCKSLVGNETNLNQYWTFDQTSGTTLQDSDDVNTYDGTLKNMDNSDWVSSTAFNTWLNTNSTTWATTTNWSRGTAPISTDNVGIPDYTIENGSYPTISSVSECNNIVVEGTLTFDYNGSHTIHGSAFVIGRSDITNGDFLTVTKNLYILLLSSLNIDPGGQLTIGNNLDIWATGTCTLKSDASSTGSLIVSGSISGNITFERYIPSGKWHYISCPIIYNVESTQFDDLSMDLGTPGSSSNQFYRWDESLSSKTIGFWVDILNGSDGSGTNTLMDDEVFNLGQGYGIYYASTPKTLSFTNEMNISNKTYTLTKTSGSTAEGANLVGNPFCSDIAINTGADTDNNFITQNTDVLDVSYRAIYLWQEGESWDGRSKDYVAINNSIEATFIEPGQAFMLMAASNNATLNFNSSIRKHGNTTFYKNSNNDNISRFELMIINPENENNTTLIAFMPEMTNGLDPSYDAGKMSGNPNLSLSTKLVEPNGIDFAIQALPPIEENTIAVKISLKAIITGEYTFKPVSIENFDENIRIMIEDKLSGEMINLRTQAEYSFTIDESGTYNNRFILHFNGATGIEDQSPESENIRFYVYNNKLYIIDKELKKGTIQLFNMLGQPVMEKQYSEAVNTLDLNLTQGYYIVRIITDKTLVSGKIYVE